MKNGKKKKGIRVDFTGVETRTLVPEGQHHVKVVEVTEEEGNAAPYLKWTFSIISDDKTNGSRLYLNTSLAKQALWNLRNLLETLGVDTPSAATDIDPDELVGLELMVRVEHETYEGKDRARVTDFTPIEETASASSDEVEEEETEDEPEEEEEEEEEKDDRMAASDIQEMDEGELAALVKKHKLKVDLASIKKASKKVGAVIDAMEEKDLLAAS